VQGIALTRAVFAAWLREDGQGRQTLNTSRTSGGLLSTPDFAQTIHAFRMLTPRSLLTPLVALSVPCHGLFSRLMNMRWNEHAGIKHQEMSRPNPASCLASQHPTFWVLTPLTPLQLTPALP
jgi:hypothetical protein